MKLKMYSVYDAKAEAYLPPFYKRARGEALRAWETSVNDLEHNFSRFPADYTLFEIGEFDDETGRCEMLPAHHPLGCALEYVKFNEGKKQFSIGDMNKLGEASALPLLQKGAK